MNDPLAAYRPLVAAEVERAFQRRRLHHADLTRRHLAESRHGTGDAAALCVLLAEAFGASGDAGASAAAVIDLLGGAADLQDGIARAQIAAGEGADRWEMPLALNASDGLFALDELAALDLVAAEPPGQRQSTDLAAFDEHCLRLFEAIQNHEALLAAGPVSISSYLETAGRSRGVLFSLAVRLAALAAGVQPPAAAEEFAANLGVVAALAADYDKVWLERDGAEADESLGSTYPFAWASEAGGSQTAKVRENLDSTGARQATREAILRYLGRVEAALDQWGLAPTHRERITAATAHIAKKDLP